MNKPQTLDFSAISSLIIISKYLWQLVLQAVIIPQVDVYIGTI